MFQQDKQQSLSSDWYFLLSKHKQEQMSIHDTIYIILLYFTL